MVETLSWGEKSIRLLYCSETKDKEIYIFDDTCVPVRAGVEGIESERRRPRKSSTEAD